MGLSSAAESTPIMGARPPKSDGIAPESLTCLFERIIGFISKLLPLFYAVYTTCRGRRRLDGPVFLCEVRRGKSFITLETVPGV